MRRAHDDNDQEHMELLKRNSGTQSIQKKYSSWPEGYQEKEKALVAFTRLPGQPVDIADKLLTSTITFSHWGLQRNIRSIRIHWRLPDAIPVSDGSVITSRGGYRILGEPEDHEKTQTHQALITITGYVNTALRCWGHVLVSQHKHAVIRASKALSG